MRCEVVYATHGRQYLWELELPQGATVREALAAARALAASGAEPEMQGIPWDEAPVGIFGEPCDRGAMLRDGDRVEIYRPLMHDPKQARRERARRRR